MIEEVWCMRILTCVMMSRFFCFLNWVSTHGTMILHANGYAWQKTCFLIFKHKESKHYCRDQDPEIHDEKLVMLYLFWSFVFFMLESIVLFLIIKLIFIENVGWNLKYFERKFWKESNDCKREVTRCSNIGKHVLKRRNKVSKPWQGVENPS